ncbi:MAG: SHOCT domain-containing protein [Chloroflexota bacterium]
MGQALTLVRPTSGRVLALLGVAAAFLLAGCNQVGTQAVTFWDLIWSMVVFFFWFMFIWIFISLFGDIIRRDDLSGGAKAIWILALVFLPFLGALIYIAMRPKVTAQDVRMLAQAEASEKAVAGVSSADEIAKLQQLKAAGAITDAEYESLKQKAMA